MVPEYSRNWSQPLLDITKVDAERRSSFDAEGDEHEGIAVDNLKMYLHFLYKAFKFLDRDEIAKGLP